MHITIKTKVSAPWQTVRSGFNEKLFLALNPPFPPVRLLRFDGCKKGDIVSLRLNFIFFTQNWTSEIESDNEDTHSFTFVDVGRQLPFFLSYWKHKHQICEGAASSESEITDHIEYKTGFLLTDLLLFPVLYAQFHYRKPVYRKFFAVKQG